jgi:hypothetical protein
MHVIHCISNFWDYCYVIIMYSSVFNQVRRRKVLYFSSCTFLCIDTRSCCYCKYRSGVKNPMMHHSFNLPSGKIPIVDERICIKMCSQTKKLFIKVWKKTYEYYTVLIFMYETIFCFCKLVVFYGCRDLFSLASALPGFGWE